MSLALALYYYVFGGDFRFYFPFQRSTYSTNHSKKKAGVFQCDKPSAVTYHFLLVLHLRFCMSFQCHKVSDFWIIFFQAFDIKKFPNL